MRLVLISPPENVPRELPLLEDMFRRGLDRFHLRKPAMSMQEYRSYLQAISARYRSRVMIHGHHSLCRDLSLSGIHYTEKTRPAVLQRSKGQVISTAFHSVEQLWHAGKTYGDLFDYALLSPVFDSISKSGYRSANFDPVEIKRVLFSLPFPILALGGVEADNIERVKELGFRGVAVIGAVWMKKDPVEAFVELKATCDRL